MAHIPKHRKLKRVVGITKRTQHLKSFAKHECYKLYKKLKSNNNCLAKALSKEKQECQMLFSQNVALVAEVQDLGAECNKRDNVILDVMKNAKEMLKMIVTMSGYITNTISSCQDFVTSSNTNIAASYGSAERNDTSRRLSTKSPARGVVKPMVSGHTITKPTINLSRVNMQRINNPSNLSTIQEAPATPERNEEVRNIRPSGTIPINRPVGYEKRRPCRLPERLTVISPRLSDEDEHRLSRRSSGHAARMSGRYSRPKSGRSSGNHFPRCSMDNIEHVGSPRVKLNDVSMLLQNSHSVNVRTLVERRNNVVNENDESPESSDATAANDSSNANVSANVSANETHASIENPGRDESRKDPEAKDWCLNDTADESSIVEANRRSQQHRRNGRNNSANWDDPLEGPSWLLNNDETGADSRIEHSESVTNAAKGNSAHYRTEGSLELSSDVVDTTRRSSPPPLPPPSPSSPPTPPSPPIPPSPSSPSSPSPLPSLDAARNATPSADKTFTREERYNAIDKNSFAASFGGQRAARTVDGAQRREKREKRENQQNLANLARFITHRRGGPATQLDDETDDFTLMFAQPSERNFHHDINDLRLPVLDGPIVKPTTHNEPEPEITTTIQRITQNCPIPSVSDDRAEDSIFDEATIKLSLLNNVGRDIELTPLKDRQSGAQKSRKKTRRDSSFEAGDSPLIEPAQSHDRTRGRARKKTSNGKDPSTAKVVLQKLNDLHARQRTPSPDDEAHLSRDSARSFARRSPVSFHTEHSSDSDSSNASTNSRSTSSRPRRRKAPVNLREPSLVKKLRRH